MNQDSNPLKELTWIHFQQNNDGTITVTCNIEKFTFVIPLKLNELFNVLSAGRAIGIDDYTLANTLMHQVPTPDDL